LKTEFTPQEIEKLEQLKNEYHLLDEEISNLRKQIKSLEQKQAKSFAEYFGIMHPEYKSTFDKRLLPYGW